MERAFDDESKSTEVAMVNHRHDGKRMGSRRE